MALDPRQIHYGVDGLQYGPVDLEELRRRIAEGQVGADDFVWDPGHQDWIVLRRYPVLFEPEDAAGADPRIGERTGDDEGGDTEEGGDPTRAPARVHYELEPVAEDHPLVWRRRTGLPYASFWARLVAFLIDDLVLIAPAMIWLLTVQSLTGTDLAEVLDVMWRSTFEDVQMTPEQQSFMRQFQFGTLVLRALYWSAMESSRWQATVGKRVLGLVVTDERGYRLRFSQALVRFFGRLLCELTFFLGYLLMLFTARRQGLHDLIARTFVVRGR